MLVVALSLLLEGLELILHVLHSMSRYMRVYWTREYGDAMLAAMDRLVVECENNNIPPSYPSLYIILISQNTVKYSTESPPKCFHDNEDRKKGRFYCTVTTNNLGYLSNTFPSYCVG